MPSRRVPEATRKRVFARDRVCQCCGTADRLVIDHIVPRADGGTNDEANLQVLCRPCNCRKSRRPTVEPPVSLFESSGNQRMSTVTGVRIHPGLVATVDARAENAAMNRSEMIRRMLAYAALKMPAGWRPPA